MKLVRFSRDGHIALGVLNEDEIAEIPPEISSDMAELIADRVSGVLAVEDLAGGARHSLTEVRLLAPFVPKKNVFAVGRNYLEHVKERGEERPVPEYPIFFTMPPTAVIGPGDAIDTSNDPSGTTDYEGELAIVIGLSGRRIPVERAWEHVFGYTICNDVTARTLQTRHGQWLLGKGPDTFCPLGPSVVTADEVGDVTLLRVRTTVNDEVRQDAPVSDLIFGIPTLISTLSSVMTLESGDIIATGTPGGVGVGFDPPRYLQPGDEVTVAIDGIGTLWNPVV